MLVYSSGSLPNQVGVIAAPGIIALNKMWNRLEGDKAPYSITLFLPPHPRQMREWAALVSVGLAEDHAHARTIANKILELADKNQVADCVGLDSQAVETNILYIEIKGDVDARKVVDYLKQVVSGRRHPFFFF